MLPILVPATSAKATALLFLNGVPAYGRELPEKALEIFADEGRRTKFEREFGRVSESQQAGVRAALLLMQAIEKRDPRELRNYATWQAVAEVKVEQEMVERLKPIFKAAPHAFEAMRQAVSSQRERAHAEEKSKLDRRISSRSPLASVAELLLQVNRWVRDARFVLYFDRSQKKTLPGLYCPNVGTGLSALTFDRVPSSHGLGVCRRCGKAFLRTKPVQPYHSLRCGNADRKARERARKRSNTK